VSDADCSRLPDYIHPVRSVGVICTPRLAYLTLAIDGAIADTPVERVEVCGSVRVLGGAPVDARRDQARARAASARRIVLLMPEQGRHKRTYQELAPRVALETLVRVAAVQEGIPIEVLARPTVRSRLGIPRAGELASHVATVVTEPVGRYWTAGRDVAALAALAGDTDGEA